MKAVNTFTVKYGLATIYFRHEEEEKPAAEGSLFSNNGFRAWTQVMSSNNDAICHIKTFPLLLRNNSLSATLGK